MTSTISCPFCRPPRLRHGGMKIAFLATDLCPEHLEMSGIPQFEADHPLVDGERPCTDTCGCISGDDAFRFLEDPEGFEHGRRARPQEAPDA